MLVMVGLTLKIPSLRIHQSQGVLTLILGVVLEHLFPLHLAHHDLVLSVMFWKHYWTRLFFLPSLLSLDVVIYLAHLAGKSEDYSFQTDAGSFNISSLSFFIHGHHFYFLQPTIVFRFVIKVLW